MKNSLFLVLPLAFLCLSCTKGRDTNLQPEIKVVIPHATSTTKTPEVSLNTNPTIIKSSETKTTETDQVKVAPTQSEKVAEVDSKIEDKNEFKLLITATNFLADNISTSTCDATNQIISLNLEDINKEFIICKNDKVELSILSNVGVVTYHTKDLLLNLELIAKAGSSSQEYVLGKDKDLSRYSPENPYGLTNLAVQDISNISQDDFKHYLGLSAQRFSLKAQAKLKKIIGENVSDEMLDDIAKIEKRIQRLCERVVAEALEAQAQ